MDNFGQTIAIFGGIAAIISGLAGAFASITKGMANLRQMREHQLVPVSPGTHQATTQTGQAPPSIESPKISPQPAVPSSSYGSPPVRFGATPPSASPAVPLPAAAQKRFNYPRLGVFSIVSLLGIVATLPILAAQSSSLSQPILLILYEMFALMYTISWIYTIVKSIQLRRWGWLVGMFFFVGYGSIVFSIRGPLQRKV